MADWRQIQARIRKAKHAPDAPAKLSELFERTRDAMVAWELGIVEEKAEHKDEAVKWYTLAAQRFRRADWKKKAEEALTKLGAEVPASSPETNDNENSEAESADAPTARSGKSAAQEAEFDSSEFLTKTHEVGNTRMPLAAGEIPETADEDDDAEEGEAEDSQAPAGAGEVSATAEGSAPGKKKRRRGRRGGRGRRRKGPAAPAGLPAQAFAESQPQQMRPEIVRPANVERRTVERDVSERPFAGRSHREGATPAMSASSIPAATRTPTQMPNRSARVVEPTPPQLPSERTAHGRAGDPALASRISHLESMLRRLVASPLHKMDEAEAAPAGPGVFLLSDSDQISTYYVEACQTLRIGLANLARGGQSGRGVKNTRGGRGYTDSGLKTKLAEHLGISEAKVGQYVKDHCVVRWIQLDDDAGLLAHFAVSVLRTPLNLDS